MSPRTGRRLHLAMMAVWLVQMGVVAFVVAGWKLYLLEISLYANVVGNWSGFSAERPTEVVES